jgi:hypothetical protein
VLSLYFDGLPKRVLGHDRSPHSKLLRTVRQLAFMSIDARSTFAVAVPSPRRTGL